MEWEDCTGYVQMGWSLGDKKCEGKGHTLKEQSADVRASQLLG